MSGKNVPVVTFTLGGKRKTPEEEGVPKALRYQSQGQSSDFRDFSKLELKKDHASRPIWVCPDGHIFLETFSPVYKQASDFLVAISEPEVRSVHFHEYQLTPFSLYAAASVGLHLNDILSVLNRLSKVVIPSKVKSFIESCTENWGKVKLVLQRNRYFLESPEPEILQKLLKDEQISAARVKFQSDFTVDPKSNLIITKTIASAPANISGVSANLPMIDPTLQNDDLNAPTNFDDEDDDKVESVEQEIHAFEILVNSVEQVKKRCQDIEIPALEEYDFRNDTSTPNLAIELRRTAAIRPYQERSLSKMFGNGRARSGVIVLPCGAGKSLVGITAACTIKKSTLVLCINAVSVDQWKHQFLKWTHVEDKHVSRFTSSTKEQLNPNAAIVITTYTMMTHSGKRSAEAQKIMDALESREWGLVILDEVHVVPAEVFRKVFIKAKAHCKMGLTATLVREDQKISHLNFLIGPKLYEANWMDLTKAGYIANVQCVEVWCPMTQEFYKEYLNASSSARKLLLHTLNPLKFRYTQFLVEYHEKRGDRIIVFSDNIYALEYYARKLDRPYIFGETSHAERTRVLGYFRTTNTCNTIFLSKVGDTAIDLPEANVLIQISSHFGSRRQEAQRLGRILRPKARSEDEFNAFFYSLISKDTEEAYYSAKRQQFLVDQGYTFKIVTHLPIEQHRLAFGKKEEQLSLLAEVLKVDESKGKEEETNEQDDILKEYGGGGRQAAVRSTGSAKSLSGAGGRSYVEVKKSIRHPLFQQRTKQQKLAKM